MMCLLDFNNPCAHFMGLGGSEHAQSMCDDLGERQVYELFVSDLPKVPNGMRSVWFWYLYLTNCQH